MLRYLKNVVTLEVDRSLCTGCGMCVEVCPHGVLELREDRASIVDRDACIECGACAQNCPVNAIAVRSGVGCASGLIKSRLGSKDPCCGTANGETNACCGNQHEN